MTSRTYSTDVSADNPLCRRLQQEFRGRGLRSSAGKLRRTETSEMLERVKRGLDPYENVPNPSKKTVSASGGNSRPAASRVSSAARAARPTAPARSAAPSVSSARPAAASRVDHTAVPVRKTTAAAAVSVPQTGVRGWIREQMDARRSLVSYRRQILREEVKVQSSFPVAAVFMLVIFTAMALVLLLSFSQNYELEGEISQLQNEAYRLAQLQRDLEIQLEERDDIRVIEQIAVNELGMVKNDLVESRFVSVSGGDRIELAEPEEQAVQAGLWSTMLSAIGENFTKIREYID